MAEEMTVFESVLKPASGGFGHWDMGEACECEGCEGLADWRGVAIENGYTVEEAQDVSGKVYGQNGATIYRLIDHRGAESLHAVWTEVVNPA